MKNIKVNLIGAIDKKSSFSQDNRNLLNGLKLLGYDATNSNHFPETVDNTDIFIHYSFEDDFNKIEYPRNGKVISFRTWDFGPYPPTWATKIKNECNQLWVYSQWTKEKAIEAGIPEEMIFVIPLGIVTNQFNIESPTSNILKKNITTFKFIFVGGTIYRKGIDILLKAYNSEFSDEEDVSLIIKGNVEDLFYKNIQFDEEIQEASSASSSPKIDYIKEYLSFEEMNKLIQSADVGVFPYRSEGFAKPILELMSVGIPSIVPNFGPCKDYCSPESSFFVNTRKVILPFEQEVEYNTLGFKVIVDSVEFSEMDHKLLAAEMRRVFENRDEIIQKSLIGKEIVRGNFMWSHTMELVNAAIQSIE